MGRLRISKEYNKRSVESESALPNRKFYFAFEGNKTEPDYFHGLQNNKRDIGINNLIEIIPLDREVDDTMSHPNHIFDGVKEFFNKVKKEEKNDPLDYDPEYDSELDEIWLVFDRDKQNVSEEQLDEIKQKCNDLGYNIALSNPKFEFWLLCHFEDIEQYPLKKLLEDRSVSTKHTFMSKKLTKLLPSGYGNKKIIFFNDLTWRIDLAIEQSKKFATDFESLKDQLGTNIGLLIEKMKAK